MNKVLSIAAAIAFTAIAANAAQDGTAYSTKSSFGAKQLSAPNIERILYPVQRMCSACKVPLTVNNQVATKPGHGTIQATVSVDQCPSCGAKFVKELKQTQYVHTCTSHCCGV